MLEVFTLKDLEDIDQGIRKVVGLGQSPQYTVEPRPSGIPVVLTYEGGSLSRAAAGSDPSGEEDVTGNIKTILTVPLIIDAVIGPKRPPGHLEVWGIVYDEGGFGNRPKSLSKSGDTVSASLIGADLKVTAKRPLNLFCYGAIREPELGKRIEVGSHYDLMLQLQDWSFRVNRPQITRCGSISAVVETIRRVEEKRGQFPYGMDGALVQVNPLDQRAAFEAAWGHEGVIAYAFK